MPFTHIPSPPTLFPTYLVPPLPFRKRQSSTDSDSSNVSEASSSPSTSPTQNEETYLGGSNSHLRCARCSSDLALSSQIISKGFTGRHGRAYLVAATSTSLSTDPIALGTAKARNDALPNLPNTYTHKPVPRQLVTGAHTVGDIICAQCGSVLGWKYIAAEEEAQRYKVGKFILETKRVARSSDWDDDHDHNGADGWEGKKRPLGSRSLPPNEMPSSAQEIEFDSQDEDECEDLFMGVWTPQLAAKRRKQKRFAKINEV